MDQVTKDYLKGRPFAPPSDYWLQACENWDSLRSDTDANFDRVVKVELSKLEPQISWGTSPEMVVGVSSSIPSPSKQVDPVKQQSLQRALDYMGLQAGQTWDQVALDKVFIGSCTNSRIEDLRKAAAVVKGKKVSSKIKQALVVPGSGLVKRQAEQEGLDKVFTDAGFEWREPGCSMCLAMNADKLKPHERCASTSNRNFEGRQGPGGRTHLVSPAIDDNTGFSCFSYGFF